MENERFQNLVLEHLARLTQDLTEFKSDTKNRFDIIDSRFEAIDSRFEQMDSRLARVESSVVNINSRLGRVESSVTNLDSRLARVESSLIRIENDHGEKLRALFDAREVQLEVNERIFDSLNRLEGKIDRIGLTVSTHDALLTKVK